jgi:hypothetical protein
MPPITEDIKVLHEDAWEYIEDIFHSFIIQQNPYVVRNQLVSYFKLLYGEDFNKLTLPTVQELTETIEYQQTVIQSTGLTKDSDLNDLYVDEALIMETPEESASNED